MFSSVQFITIQKLAFELGFFVVPGYMAFEYLFRGELFFTLRINAFKFLIVVLN